MKTNKNSNKDTALKVFGKTCKKFREASGQTLYDIAVATGYSPYTVHSFEDGRNNNLYIFMYYASHYHITFTDIEEVMNNE